MHTWLALALLGVDVELYFFLLAAARANKELEKEEGNMDKSDEAVEPLNMDALDDTDDDCNEFE